MTESREVIVGSEARARPPALAAGGRVAAIVPHSIEEAFRVASALAGSGLAPRDLNTPEKCLVVIMAGAELGMAPFQAMQSFAVVNGRPALWGDGMLAIVRAAGVKVEERFEGSVDGAEPNGVAICKITRPDTGEVIERQFTVGDAKRAKLWMKRGANGGETPWVTYPQRMLQMRARAWACRDGVADVLRGIQMAEEQQDVAAPVAVTVTSDARVMEEPKEIARPRGVARDALLEEIIFRMDAAPSDGALTEIWKTECEPMRGRLTSHAFDALSDVLTRNEVRLERENHQAARGEVDVANQVLSDDKPASIDFEAARQFGEDTIAIFSRPAWAIWLSMMKPEALAALPKHQRDALREIHARGSAAFAHEQNPRGGAEGAASPLAAGNEAAERSGAESSAPTSDRADEPDAPGAASPDAGGRAAPPGAAADSPDDAFPGDRPPGFVFKLVTIAGAAHSTTNGAQWAHTLEGMFGKASDEGCRTLWRRNAGIIDAIYATDDVDAMAHARRVEIAWKKRGLA